MFSYSEQCEKNKVSAASEITLKEKMCIGDTLHDFAEHVRDNADEPYDTEMTNIFKHHILKDALSPDFKFIREADYADYNKFKLLFFGPSFSNYASEKSYERRLTALITDQTKMQPCTTTVRMSEVMAMYQDPRKHANIVEKIRQSNGSLRLVLDKFDKNTTDARTKLQLARFIKTYMYGDMNQIADENAAPQEIRFLFDAGTKRIGRIFSTKGSGGIRFYSMPCTGDSAGTSSDEDKLLLDPEKAIEYDARPELNFTSNYITCGAYSAGYFTKPGTTFGEDGTPYGCVLKIWKTGNPRDAVEYYFGPSVTTGSGVADIGKIFKRMDKKMALDAIVSEMKRSDHKTRLKLFTNQFVQLFGRDADAMKRFLVDYKRSGDFEQFLSVLHKIKDGNLGNYTFCSIDIMAITCARMYGIPAIWQYDNEIEMYRSDRYRGSAKEQEAFLLASLARRAESIRNELATSQETLARLKAGRPRAEKILQFLGPFVDRHMTSATDIKQLVGRLEIRGAMLCLEKYLVKLDAISLEDYLPVYWSEDRATGFEPVQSLNEEINYYRQNNQAILDLLDFVAINAPDMVNLRDEDVPTSDDAFAVPALALNYQNLVSKNRDVQAILRLYTVFMEQKTTLDRAVQDNKRTKTIEALKDALNVSAGNLFTKIYAYLGSIYYAPEDRAALLKAIPYETLPETITPSQPAEPVAVAAPGPAPARTRAVPRGRPPTKTQTKTRKTVPKTAASVRPPTSARRTLKRARETPTVAPPSTRRTRKIQRGGDILGRTQKTQQRQTLRRRTAMSEARVSDAYYEGLHELFMRIYNRCNVYMKSLVPLARRHQGYFDIMKDIPQIWQTDGDEDAGDPDQWTDAFFIELVGFVKSELDVLSETHGPPSRLPIDVVFLLYLLGVLFDAKNDVEGGYIQAFQRDENLFQSYVSAADYEIFMTGNTVYNHWIQVLNNYRFSKENNFNCTLAIVSVFALLEKLYYGKPVATFLDLSQLFNATETNELVQMRNFDSSKIYLTGTLKQHLNAALPALVTQYTQTQTQAASTSESGASTQAPVAST